MKKIIISAVSENGVIGNDDKIPWHIKEDFLHFKNKTTSNIVIMGSKTYQSMGKALPKRLNVVLSRSIKKLPDALVFSNFEESVRASEIIAKNQNSDIYFIGGSAIYEAGLREADVMYLSHVKGSYEGNVYFPEFSKDEWEVESEEEYKDFILKKYVKLNLDNKGEK